MANKSAGGKGAIMAYLPACDQWGTPVEKMPNCPRCDEDELGMIVNGMAYCYSCGVAVVRAEVPVVPGAEGPV